MPSDHFPNAAEQDAFYASLPPPVMPPGYPQAPMGYESLKSLPSDEHHGLQKEKGNA